MEDGTKNFSCSAKSVCKFCLIYVTILLFTTLVFTALNSEPMTSVQVKWWWAFIMLLILCTALSASALGLMIYSNMKKPATVDYDLVQSRDVIKSLADGNSTSYKTVLTISSLPPPNESSLNQQPPSTLPQALPHVQIQAEDSTPVAVKSQFLNLTPAKSPVTVVDIPSRKKNITDTKGSKLAEPSNLAALSSTANATAGGTKKKKPHKTPKPGAKKKK